MGHLSGLKEINVALLAETKVQKTVVQFPQKCNYWPGPNTVPVSCVQHMYHS